MFYPCGKNVAIRRWLTYEAPCGSLKLRPGIRTSCCAAAIDSRPPDILLLRDPNVCAMTNPFRPVTSAHYLSRRAATGTIDAARRLGPPGVALTGAALDDPPGVALDDPPGVTLDD